MNEKPLQKTSIGGVPITCFWAAGGALAGLLLLLAIAIFGPMLYLNRPMPTPTWDFSVIDNPTSTPNPTATIASTTEAGPSPTATIELPAEGSFMVGELVEVRGTGGDGLRVRESPGMDGTILFVGFENEVFVVQAGPIEQDGHAWWYLVNPYDDDKRGWAVADYLRPLESQ